MRVLLPLLLTAVVSFASPVDAIQQVRENHKATIASNDLGIDVRQGRVFLNVVNADLSEVLRVLAQRSGIRFEIDENIQASLTLRLEGVGIEAALERLCRNRAIVYAYDASSNTFRILRVAAVASAPKQGHPNRQDPASTGSAIIDSMANPDARSTSPLSPKAPRSAMRVDPAYERQYGRRGRLLYLPGELLVRFRPGADPVKVATLHQTLGSRVIRQLPRLRIDRIMFRPQLSAPDVIAAYISSGLVQNAEKHALRYPENSFPDDPFFPDQYGLDRIDAGGAWDYIRSCSPTEEVVVAVIDTGVDYNHPDLAPVMWVNAREQSGATGVDDDGNGYVDDIYGYDFAENDPDPMDSGTYGEHGTHVAGIIGSKINNGVGIAGVALNVKIMALKVQYENSNSFSDDAILAAIDYAIDNGAKIVNCSFGGGGKSEIEETAFQNLHATGLLSVCAAGNYGSNNDAVAHYPSNYTVSSLIAVASSNARDEFYSNSNYGPTTVDLMAPGVNIYSTFPGRDYGYLTGTSMATPHVTGVAALLWSLNPAMTPMEIKGTLLGSVDRIPYTYIDSRVGVHTGQGVTQYTAAEMDKAGLTDGDGITAMAYDCGQGYTDQIPPGINGNIALIQRGNRDGVSFYFRDKVANVQNAGAVAAMIYNHNPAEDHYGWTLADSGNWIPVVCLAKSDGENILGMLPVSVTVVNRTAVSTDTLFDKLVSGGRLNAFAAVKSIMMGDLSGDYRTGLDDAILSLQVMGLSQTEIEISEKALAMIDVDGDGVLGNAEAIYVLQILGGARDH